MKAVVDEISDGKVKLLVGEEEREVVLSKNEIDSGLSLSEGDWLEVKLVKEQLKILKKDPNTTESRKERIRKKLERLRQKGK
ncbi:MAG: DUF3006 domain-containing protein [Balneolaceae bacterium]|nr:DUF3006 domain-containing protein [Balneolaceae bacterium]